MKTLELLKNVKSVKNTHAIKGGNNITSVTINVTSISVTSSVIGINSSLKP